MNFPHCLIIQKLEKMRKKCLKVQINLLSHAPTKKRCPRHLFYLWAMGSSVTNIFPDGKISRRKVAWRPRRFTRPRLAVLALPSANSHKAPAFESSRKQINLLSHAPTKKRCPRHLFYLWAMGSSVTNIFPDGKISRPRLAVLALPSANSHKAPAFESSRKQINLLSHAPTKKRCPRHLFYLWAMEDSNPRPTRCKRVALAN
jgi:hypothetical protein